ncbi:POT family [Musa troglodytarum]|uniref:POT family n=5 Tax=Musa troglodytarum TaxID=320322 RepID=A0A9E7F604_9LILI|nr:POT family [Musa troglodytarum]
MDHNPLLLDGAGDASDESGREERKPGGWKSLPFIIGNEAFERVATSGLTANFMVYLVEQYGMRQMAAATLCNVFSGTSNAAPLLGAFVSDAYWGRFRTLTYASVTTFVGMVVLTLTAAVPQLRPPVAEQSGQPLGPSGAHLAILFLSLGLLVLGAGGVRPCSLPFGVDQFDRSTEQGRRGLNSFFNWYYSISTAATVVAMTAVVYIQDSVSWPLGFGIPTALMLLAIILFFAGIRLYVFVPPDGSVFSGVLQALVAAFRKRKLRLPAPNDAVEQETLLYSNHARKSTVVTKLPLTLQFRFLNKAAIVCEGDMKEDGRSADPWKLCSVQQIEEVKCLMRIAPIWASGIICFVALTQQWTLAALQSMKMDRHLGPSFQIPPGSLGTICLMAIVLFIPLYDQILVPMATSITGVEGGITLLQRQGAGMAIAIMSMVVAGLVEKKRRDSALAHGGADGTSPLSAMWLAPQLCLMGVAEAFNAVGQVEFYNRQFPEHMQTLAGSLFHCSLAGASYLSSFLIAFVRKSTGGPGGASWLDDDINVGRVDYYYYLIAALGVGNLLYFMVCAHLYRYKGTPELEDVCKDIKAVF